MSELRFVSREFRGPRATVLATLGVAWLAGSPGAVRAAGGQDPPVADEAPVETGGPAEVRLDRSVFRPGEELEVRFRAPAGYPRDAWIGVVPAETPHGSETVNDEADLSYVHLENRTSGTVVLPVPPRPGEYDVRMHDTDADGREVAYAPFHVVPGERRPASLALRRAEFAAGEEIAVTFTAPPECAPDAWIGIVPATVPHGSEALADRHVVSYEHLSGRTAGTVVLIAPAAPGTYDVRMHDTDADGVEVFSIAFRVRASPGYAPSLVLERGSFRPGEEIRVRFNAPAGLAEDAWVGVVPAGVPHGTEALNDEHDLSYEHLSGRTSGSLVFWAPDLPGPYDLRMHDTDADGIELTAIGFAVR
jgi:hypothetical protein